MPIYSYKCKKCGKVFEKFQKVGLNNIEYCEECKSEAHRIFSPVGIIFKGSGFYSTDYKSGSNKSIINTAQSGKEEKKEIKEDKKTDDSKPAQSSETKDKTAASSEKVKK